MFNCNTNGLNNTNISNKKITYNINKKKSSGKKDILKLKKKKKNSTPIYSSCANTILDYETDSDSELDDNLHNLSYISLEKFIFYGIEYQKDYENNVYIYNDNTYMLCGKYENGRIC